MFHDVTEFLRTCVICQTTNDAKFVKKAAPLHPIPMKPEVWRQVYMCVHAVKFNQPTIINY